MHAYLYSVTPPDPPPSNGSTPASWNASGNRHRSPERQNGGKTSGATILIVDDNEVFREGIRIMIEADGLNARVAGDGQEALEEMKQITPDLILSDISMPKMDGYTFFELVRSNPEWMAVPFIFLTAHGSREDIILGRQLGADDYLVKPVSREELLTTIRSRLLRSQQLLLAQLQNSYEASLILLANAIELRDEYTRGHVERVMHFATLLGREMDWPEAQGNVLQFGSILHDVGKIHIRERILQKPGPLSTDEWGEMKQHPVIGAELVKDIPYLAPALPVIRSHHERWDGEGYPEGLAGKDIPQAARIVAVADSLDAMTTSRVYKEARSGSDAYNEILAGSGTRYDPEVVMAFEAAWDSFEPLVS